MLETPYKLEAPYMLEADFRIAFMRFQDMGYPENTYGVYGKYQFPYTLHAHLTFRVYGKYRFPYTLQALLR